MFWALFVKYKKIYIAKIYIALPEQFYLKERKISYFLLCKKKSV